MKQANTEFEYEKLRLAINLRLGMATLTGTGSAIDVAQILNRYMIPRMLGVGQRQVLKPPGRAKGFDFHWSNAQASWDVILVPGVPWDEDGASFVLWCPATTLSPIGKPWTRTEMQYVARSLKHHPGYAGSYESSSRRIASRYLSKVSE